MINVNFKEKDLEFLRELFQVELYKAEQKVDSIKNILSEIGKKSEKIHKQVEKAAKKKSRVKTKISVKAKPRVKDLAKVTAKLKPVVEKKKPGRKPKIKLAELLSPLEKTTAKIRKAKSVKKVAGQVTERKKPGPKPKIKDATTEPKVEAKKNIIKKVKPRAKTAQKKTTDLNKFRKFPWQEWVLRVLREKGDKLNQQEIVNAIAAQLQLSGKEITTVNNKIKENLLKLLKSDKVTKSSEGGSEIPYFASKVNGE